MQKISLFKDLARTGFHSSIITTYSVDAAFYDGSVQHRLRTYGCDNNILVADAQMLERALVETPEGFAQGGTSYAVVPVHMAGCFHPKLHLRLGADSGSLIVGSANATAAGWGRNREIIASFEWKRGKDMPDAAAFAHIIRKGYDYAAAWLTTAGSAAIGQKLRLIERDIDWLFDVSANAEPVELSDGSLVDLFCEAGNGTGLSMLERLHGLVAGTAVRRLVVLSPYWDASLDALHELRSAFRPDETVIALSAARPEFPKPDLAIEASLRFAPVFGGSDAGRFIHAKIFVIETHEHDHILFGSANCSDEALGLLTAPASNAEVSVYRRVAPGSALASLGLDISGTIDPSDITATTAAPRTPQSVRPLQPGTIQAAGRAISWQPSPQVGTSVGASLVVGDTAHPFTSERNGIHRLQLPERPSYPLIVRIRLADGRISGPVLLNDETALARAATGVINQRLHDAFQRIEQGGELLDLASLASLIFSGSGKNEPSRTGRARTTTGGPGPDANGKNYDSPEDFRRAMAAEAPATGENQALNFDDPESIGLIRIVLRGIADYEQGDADLDAALLAGDRGEQSDEGTVPSANSSAALAGAPQPKVYSKDDIDRRRTDALKAMTAFDSYLAKLQAGQDRPPRRLTAETCFILRLMVEACRRPFRLEDRTGVYEVYPLHLVPRDRERDRCFSIRAVQMLQRLWLPSGRQSALLSRISIVGHAAGLPYDCFALVVLSRWVLARADMALRDRRLADLARAVRKLAVEIWRETLKWPPIDPIAEEDMVRKLEAVIGIEASETEELIGNYQALSAGLRVTA